MDGLEDLSNLFSRVNALEQSDTDSDLFISRISKLYATVGLKVTFTMSLHQYRLAGDTNPLYGAVTGTDTYL